MAAVSRVGLVLLGAAALLTLPAPAAGQPAPPAAAAAADGGGPALEAVGRGLAALARDDAAGALTQFDAAIAADAQSAAAWHGRGAALVRLERREEARTALKRALELCPGCYEVRLDLAVAYLADGNRLWATRALAVDPPVDRPELMARRDALLGLALVETGRHEEALTLLEPEEGEAAAAAPADPELESWRSLVVGRARLTDGRIHDALGALAEAGRVSPDPRLRGVADDLLAIALQADNPEPGWVSASAAAGVEFDSNALYDPELPGGHEAHPGAGRAFLRAAVSLRPLNTGAHRLAGDAAFFRSFHFLDDDAPQLDLTEVATSVRYAWRFVAGPTDDTIQLRYLFVLDLLEGGALLPEPGRFAFMEAHGGEVSWQLVPADWLETRVTYTFQRRLFAELARDAWMHQGTVSQTFLLGGGRVRLSVDLSGRGDDADIGRYDLAGILAGARVACRVPPLEVEVFARASYTWLTYPDSAGRFDQALPHTGRTDHVVDLAGGVGRGFLDDHLTVALQLRYNLHASTIPAYDYDRYVVTAVVGGRL